MLRPSFCSPLAPFLAHPSSVFPRQTARFATPPDKMGRFTRACSFARNPKSAIVSKVLARFLCGFSIRNWQ